MARARRRLESVSRIDARQDGRPRSRLETTWNPDGIPRPDPAREEALWRRLRAAKARRTPYRGENHPARQGIEWGPYNRTSALVEALERAGEVDALWVDEFVERHRTLLTIERMLGAK